MKIEEAVRLWQSADHFDVIFDTDTFNEVDDQFALAYAMKSEKVNLLSVNAAPFLNRRSVSPEDGMEKSYEEILRITELAEPGCAIPVYRGSRAFLQTAGVPEESDACDNLIRTVREHDGPVWIVAIGAITNVASALLKCPEIAERAILVWLGGHSKQTPDTREFNMYQDVIASSTVLDSGIALFQIPCDGVCSQFHTTIPELRWYLAGKNPLSDYLVRTVEGYTSNPYAWSKVLWDVTAVGVLTNPGAFEYEIIPTPRLIPDGHYDWDPTRKPYLYVRKIHRDPVYADLFHHLSGE